MIHMDTLLLEFIQHNIVTLGLIFGIARAIAKTYDLERFGALIDSIKENVFSIRKKRK